MTHKNIMQKVKDLLTEFPQLRNDDKLLIKAYIKRYHYLTYCASFATGIDDMLAANIPHFDTITRCSRRLQQLNKHLQGTNRNQRLAKQAPVKQDLGYGIDRETANDNFQSEMFDTIHHGD